ncbi:MAG: hypothetical protein LUE14_02940 [Clostridiales bacterium]|nr:hypothetical protein [Clostridiales bacterium]
MVKCLRRAGAAALAAVMITGTFGSTQAAQAAASEEEEVLADSSSLYEGYISSIFYDDTGSDTVSVYSSDYGASVLDGSAYEVYSELKGVVEDIAAGELTSTVITLSTNLEWDKSELGITSEGTLTADDKTAIKDAVRDMMHTYLLCLMEDCPYELYWFDKSQGMAWAYSSYMDGDTVGAKNITIILYVSEDYQQDGDNTVVDASGVRRAQAAAANAKAIVAKHASESDMEKLTSYKDEICSLVSYASGSSTSGDISQLVYVFDGDSSTNVKCEGYAKAFQYLCELSSFTAEDAVCYSPGGYFGSSYNASNAAANHVWNIVTLNGVNYLTDITNSDTGMVGYDGSLFMVTDEDAEKYLPGAYYAFHGVYYSYSENNLGLFSQDILTLGEAGQTYGDSLAARRGNTWYFTYTLRSGDADMSFTYGRAGDEVLVGDWDGDGVDTICVRRGNAYYFKNSLSGGTADTVIYYGKSGDEVLAGDWDGDGVDTLAVRRGRAYYISNSIRSGEADEVVVYGKPGDTVLSGDWDGDGVDTLAVRRGNTYYFKDSLTGGEADAIISYGKATDEALAGDWDGDGADTLTVRRNNMYYISNSIASGEADKVVVYGRAADEVYAGRWY